LDIIFDSSTHIIPLIIGREKTALEFGKYLFKKGIYALPILNLPILN